MKNKGFTLVELMIAVAVIGILVAMSYPSYKAYKVRTSRAAVQTEMLNISQHLQMYKQINHSYAGAALSNSGIYGSSVSPTSGIALYDLTLTLNTANQGWTLAAVPKTGTLQDGNGSVVLNSEDQRCWQKGKTESECSISATTTWTDR